MLAEKILSLTYETFLNFKEVVMKCISAIALLFIELTEMLIVTKNANTVVDNILLVFLVY